MAPGRAHIIREDPTRDLHLQLPALVPAVEAAAPAPAPATRHYRPTTALSVVGTAAPPVIAAPAAPVVASPAPPAVATPGPRGFTEPPLAETLAALPAVPPHSVSSVAPPVAVAHNTARETLPPVVTSEGPPTSTALVQDSRITRSSARSREHDAESTASFGTPRAGTVSGRARGRGGARGRGRPRVIRAEVPVLTLDMPEVPPGDATQTSAAAALPSVENDIIAAVDAPVASSTPIAVSMVNDVPGESSMPSTASSSAGVTHLVDEDAGPATKRPVGECFSDEEGEPSKRERIEDDEEEVEADEALLPLLS